MLTPDGSFIEDFLMLIDSLFCYHMNLETHTHIHTHHSAHTAIKIPYALDTEGIVAVQRDEAKKETFLLQLL